MMARYLHGLGTVLSFNFFNWTDSIGPSSVASIAVLRQLHYITLCSMYGRSCIKCRGSTYFRDFIYCRYCILCRACILNIVYILCRERWYCRDCIYHMDCIHCRHWAWPEICMGCGEREQGKDAALHSAGISATLSNCTQMHCTAI